MNVTFNIQNTGNYDSDEVAQLYVSFPDSKVEMPAKALKGFARVFIKKGETKTVSIPLKADDLKYWDTGSRKWTLGPGRIAIAVGSSSADAKLKASLLIK